MTETSVYVGRSKGAVSLVSASTYVPNCLEQLCGARYYFEHSKRRFFYFSFGHLVRIQEEDRHTVFQKQ